MDSCYHFNYCSNLLKNLADMRANLQKERKKNLILRKKCLDLDLSLRQCRQYLYIIKPDWNTLSSLPGYRQQELSTTFDSPPSGGITSTGISLSWYDREDVAGDAILHSNESPSIVLFKTFPKEIERNIRRSSRENIDSLRQGVYTERQIGSNTDLDAIVLGAVEQTGHLRPRRKIGFSTSTITNPDDNNLVRNCPFKNQYWLRNRTVEIDFPTNSIMSDDIEDHSQETQQGQYSPGRHNERSQNSRSEEEPEDNLSEGQYCLRSRTVVFGNSTKIVFHDGLKENLPAEDRCTTERCNSERDALPEKSFSQFEASHHSTPRQQKRR